MSWTIQINAETPATLEALDVQTAMLNLRSLAEDTMTLRIQQAAFDASAWPFGAGIILRRASVIAFRGIVTDSRPFVTADAEGLEVVVSGPWWQMERCPYRQPWKVWDIAEEEVVTGYKTRAILGIDETGTRKHTGQVIAHALSLVSDYLTAGTIDPTAQAPLDEVVDVTIAEVIRRQLRWTPDCVSWFDYTTTPPTLHIRQPANLTLVTYGLDGAPVSSSTSLPRYDLKMDGVVVLYEVTTTASGTDYETITRETAGSPAEGDPLTLVLTIDIDGGSTSTQTAKITTEEIPANLNTAKAWWKARMKELTGVADGDITINVTRSGTQLYELLDGSIPDWLDSQANVETDHVYGTITYKLDGKWITVEVDHNMTTCDLQSGTRKKVSREGGESLPVGLAASIWSSVGTLWYDGSVTLTYDDPVAGPWLGKRIAVGTGGSGATQEAEIDIQAGTVRLTFGAPKHISPADFIALCRMNRSRMRARNAGRRQTGESATGGASVETGGASVRHNTHALPKNQAPQGRAATDAGHTIPASGTDKMVLTWKGSGETWNTDIGTDDEGPVWDYVRLTS